ncbi:hypothetical protein [Methanomethylovorans sp.]|uniref:hypothetical protein n=1 Tax=Methanomethylovorans sp. TaxID=2758717 RepID=UPI00351C2BC5
MGPSLMELIDLRMHLLGSLPVIRGYYLVLGGGKVGSSFLRYAKKARIPLVLIIDNDDRALASLSAEVMNDREQVADVIRSLAALQENNTSVHPSSDEAGTGASARSCIYFHRMDVHDIFPLLVHGLPEFIIPAVPSHAAADLVADALDFGQGGLVRRLSINMDDEEMSVFFENLVSAFPKGIVAGSYPEHGAIFFSYAQPGEICPDKCPGLENYCSTFSRIKPRTITSYVREAALVYPGHVFESYQMKPGIGGIRGIEMGRNLISVIEHVRALKQSPQEYSGLKERSFFIATTCNCHGIMTLFYVV